MNSFGTLQTIGLVMFVPYIATNIALNLVHRRTTLIGTGSVLVGPLLVCLTAWIGELHFRFTNNHFVESVALLMILGGMFLIQHAVRYLSTNRDDFWKARFQEKKRWLVEEGPYRAIRHPLYRGLFVMYAGLLLLFFHPITALLAALYVASIIYTALAEEKFMLSKFPEYRQYMRTTRMFF